MHTTMESLREGYLIYLNEYVTRHSQIKIYKFDLIGKKTKFIPIELAGLFLLFFKFQFRDCSLFT